MSDKSGTVFVLCPECETYFLANFAFIDRGKYHLTCDNCGESITVVITFTNLRIKMKKERKEQKEWTPL